jgi:hypothetical protein
MRAARYRSDAVTWLMEPAPAGRLNAVRILTIGYALVWIAVRTSHWRDLSHLPTSRWEPVGVMSWLGSQRTTVVTVVVVLPVVAGVAAIGAVAWQVSGPAFALGFLWLTSFGASWGQILHTEHLLVLHLLVLAAAPSGRGATSTTGWPLKVMSAVTVSTYFVAGVAKLRFGGGLDWLSGDGLLRLVAHDNLRKRLLGDTWSPIAPFAVGHPLLFQVGAWLTLVVELGAPLALLGRRWAYAWVALAWSFHVAVLAVMAVLFPYPLVGVAYASMLPVERLFAWRPSGLTQPGRGYAHLDGQARTGF